MAKRPRYDEALQWIVINDDTEWLDDEHSSLSVTAALVADLFGKGDEKITEDLKLMRKVLSGV